MTNITISVSMLMYIDVLGTMLLQSTLCSLFLLTPAGRHTPTQYEGNFNEFVHVGGGGLRQIGSVMTVTFLIVGQSCHLKCRTSDL